MLQANVSVMVQENYHLGCPVTYLTVPFVGFSARVSGVSRGLFPKLFLGTSQQYNVPEAWRIGDGSGTRQDAPWCPPGKIIPCEDPHDVIYKAETRALPARPRAGSF